MSAPRMGGWQTTALVVIDVQPYFSVSVRQTGLDLRGLARDLNAHDGPRIVLYADPAYGPMYLGDREGVVRGYLAAAGANLSSVAFIGKSFAYVTPWLRYLDEATLAAFVSLMRHCGVRHAALLPRRVVERFLEERGLRVPADPHFWEQMPILPDWVAALASVAQRFELHGGSMQRCVREVRVLLSAFGAAVVDGAHQYADQEPSALALA